MVLGCLLMLCFIRSSIKLDSNRNRFEGDSLASGFCSTEIGIAGDVLRLDLSYFNSFIFLRSSVFAEAICSVLSTNWYRGSRRVANTKMGSWSSILGSKYFLNRLLSSVCRRFTASTSPLWLFISFNSR